MNKLPTTTVNFNGAELLAVMHNGEPHVAIKPICEAIGLDWEGQRQRIERDTVLSRLTFVTKVSQFKGKDGREYFVDTVTLPLKFLNGWMFGVDDSRVREEVRPTLIEYKLNCYDILHKHFNKSFKKQVVFNEHEFRKLMPKVGQTPMSYPELKKDFERILEDALALGYTRTEALQRANLAFIANTGIDIARLIGFPDFRVGSEQKLTTLPQFCLQENMDYDKAKKWCIRSLQHLGMLTTDAKPKVTTMGAWHSQNLGSGGQDQGLDEIGWDAVTIEHLQNVHRMRLADTGRPLLGK